MQKTVFFLLFNDDLLTYFWWQDWAQLEQPGEPLGGGEDDEGGVLRPRH